MGSSASLHLCLLTCEMDPLRQMTCGVSLSVVGELSLHSLPFRRESETHAVIHWFIQQYFPSYLLGARTGIQWRGGLDASPPPTSESLQSSAERTVSLVMLGLISSNGFFMCFIYYNSDLSRYMKPAVQRTWRQWLLPHGLSALQQALTYSEHVNLALLLMSICAFQKVYVLEQKGDSFSVSLPFCQMWEGWM